MIIDVSNTLGRHRFKPEIKAEDLLAEMDKNHIDMAVVHCYPECLDNESIYRAITDFPNRFTGLYTVNPWAADSGRELCAALEERGFGGLYMDPVRHGYMLCEREVYYPLLDICRKYQVPVWCYGAAEVFSNPVFFEQMAEDYPGVNIIMGRMGLQYDNASAVEVAKRHSNIYLETSSSMDFNTLRAMKTAGISQVLLGTGTPEGGYFELELAKVKKAAAGFPDGEEMVLWKNASRIFRIREVG